MGSRWGPVSASRGAAVTARDEVALVPWPLAAARRLLAGLPLEPSVTARWHPEHPLPETLSTLAMTLAAHEAVAPRPLTAAPRWWVHQVLLDGVVVGDVGFLGPPAPDGPAEVEIGYAVVPARRGRGVATRACRALVELAWRDGAVTLLADAEPGGPASRAVLEHCGFTVRADGTHALSRPAVVPPVKADRDLPAGASR